MEIAADREAGPCPGISSHNRVPDLLYIVLDLGFQHIFDLHSRRSLRRTCKTLKLRLDPSLRSARVPSEELLEFYSTGWPQSVQELTIFFEDYEVTVDWLCLPPLPCLHSIGFIDAPVNIISPLAASLAQLTTLRKLEIEIEWGSIEEVSAGIFQLTNLQELVLSCEKLAMLPESVGHLKMLTHLNLSFTKVEELPHAIGQLTALEKLALYTTDLIHIPASIGKLQHLTYLMLYSRSLPYVPNQFWNLISLQELQIPGLVLTESLSRLQALTKLTIDGAFLRGIFRLPNATGSLKLLQNLELRDFYYFPDLPNSISALHHLTHLQAIFHLAGNLSESRVFERLPSLQSLMLRLCNKSMASDALHLPESTSCLAGLTSLHLDGHHQHGGNFERIAHLTILRQLRFCSHSLNLSKKIGQIRFLEHLAFCSLTCRTVPGPVGTFRHLTKLELRGCPKLEKLPMSFSKLRSLKYLEIEGCHALQLPESLHLLTSLTGLELMGHGNDENINRIAQIPNLKYLHMRRSADSMPESIGRMERLEFLDLGLSEFLTLPESLGNLSTLKKLNLNCCFRLRTLPRSLSRLSSLTELGLEGCSSLKNRPRMFTESGMLRLEFSS